MERTFDTEFLCEMAVLYIQDKGGIERISTTAFQVMKLHSDSEI